MKLGFKVEEWAEQFRKGCLLGRIAWPNHKSIYVPRKIRMGTSGAPKVQVSFNH